jgi:molecular chaperone HscB
MSSSPAVVPCWSCAAPRGADAPLCPACGKVQPAAPIKAGESRVSDKFAMLGFSRSFDLDDAKLPEQFRALSRKLHPDRFVKATPQERRFALEQTTRLNDAYRTLREPAKRAEHLLELRGIHLAGEGRETPHGLPIQQPVQMSMEFLEEMMEEREALLDAKHGDGGPAKMKELADSMEKKRAGTMTKVAVLLRAIEPQEHPARPDVEQVAEQIARLRYYDRYLDEALGRGAEI